MFRIITITFLALPVGALLVACNGSGDGENPAVMISAENALAYSQEATINVTRVGAIGEELNTAVSFFNTVSTGKAEPAALRKLAALATEETIACAGGGTVTVESNGASATEQTIHFVANQCTDEQNVTLHGELHVTIGPWNEFSGNDAAAFEMVMETGPGGLAAGDCEFNGGFITRFHIAGSADTHGETSLVMEYGTTSNGFISFCAPDQESNIAANTLVRNEFTIVYAEDGSMTSSNVVSIRGGFEAPDGSGYVTVVAENLEYGVTESGGSLYGVSSCPSSGRLTLTGSRDSTASIYFGSDAPPGYAVQVIGPDGFLAEFETCEEFLAASE